MNVLWNIECRDNEYPMKIKSKRRFIHTARRMGHNISEIVLILRIVAPQCQEWTSWKNYIW